MVNFESTRGLISNLEKKQKKFDQQLSEKNILAEKNAAERDSAEARARQAETKSLSLTRELELLQDQIDESDRLRKQLQVSQTLGGVREGPGRQSCGPDIQTPHFCLAV